MFLFVDLSNSDDLVMTNLLVLTNPEMLADSVTLLGCHQERS